MNGLSKYEESARFSIAMAESGFFAALREDTKEKIHILFRSMYWADRCVDELHGADKKRATALIMAYLSSVDQSSCFEGDLAHSLADLKRELNHLPPARKNAFLGAVEEIFICGGLLSVTKDPGEFISVRMREGERAAELVLLIADELDANPAFQSFYRSVGVVSNLVDSIDDAQRDKRSSEIAVKPVQIYFSLAKETLKRGATAIQQHPHKLKLTELIAGWFLARLDLARPALPANPATPRFHGVLRKHL